MALTADDVDVPHWVYSGPDDASSDKDPADIQMQTGVALTRDDLDAQLTAGWRLSPRIEGADAPPVVTALVPDTAVIGDASFTLHVHGTGFQAASVIVFAGEEEPTTVVSATEVTTGVNMDVWVGPDAVPVFVRNPDGASNVLDFTFTELTAARMAAADAEADDTPAPAAKPARKRR